MNIQHKTSLKSVCPGYFLKGQPLSTHTYFSLLTGLTVRPVRLIVQLLGDHAQEFSLVFVSIVV